MPVVSAMSSFPVPVLPERFDFEHTDLRRAGAVFVRGDDRSVMIKMGFGDMEGSLSLEWLARSLRLPRDSRDRRLLALLPEALRHVRQVCPGDLVPSELVEGRPSWLPQSHVMQRATASVWRAVQGRLHGTRSEPPATPDPGTIGMQDMAQRIHMLFPDLSAAALMERLELVVADTARVDWLRRATSNLQRTVGELAQFSKQESGKGIGDLARRAALQLREVTIWGTERAIAADAAVGDINRLLARPELLRARAWPAICALRVLALDVEPILLRWQAARSRPAGGPNLRDIEDILRLALQRYAAFEPALFSPGLTRRARGIDD